MSEYLTTKELAELLRIKERKVYDLAASGEVPCSRAMGKLLFPRKAIEAWIAGSSSGLEVVARGMSLPNVFLGSHDPLLEWALRESKCGIATFFDGSFDGLDRFRRREGIAAGLHIFDVGTGTWNIDRVRADCAGMPAVLVEWVRRKRGLIVGAKQSGRVATMTDLKGLRIAARQPESGTYHLFMHLLGETGLKPGAVDLGLMVRTETDAAVSVLEGKADVAFGLEALAAQYKLAFVPIVEERFDLLVDRRSWFEPPMQALLEFTRSHTFLARAVEHAGYDLSALGKVHFNGA